MAQYQFTAVSPDGSRKKMVLEAPNIDRLKAIVSTSGDLAINIKEAGMLNKEVEIGRVKPKDLAVFCQQMESILKAGVSALQAITMVASTTQNKKLKTRLNLVAEKVKAGSTISGSMSAYDDIFPMIMIQMIKAGEESGALDEVFHRLAQQFEKQDRLKSTLKKALAYPKMVVVIMIVALVVVCTVIMPQFAQIFTELGADIPITTKGFLLLSDLFTKYWLSTAIGVVVIVVSWVIFSRSAFGKGVLCRLKLKLPLFANLEIKIASANFSRTLCTLLKSGMDYPKALQIAGDTMTNVVFQEATIKIREDVLNGISLTDAVRKAGIFPELMTNLLEIGETTGDIPQMLENAANYFEDEVEAATMALTSAIQPAIMLILGIFVGTMVYSIYVPMFSMYNSIG